jgi:hypothetical protein
LHQFAKAWREGGGSILIVRPVDKDITKQNGTPDQPARMRKKKNQHQTKTRKIMQIALPWNIKTDEKIIGKREKDILTNSALFMRFPSFNLAIPF